MIWFLLSATRKPMMLKELVFSLDSFLLTCWREKLGKCWSVFVELMSCLPGKRGHCPGYCIKTKIWYRGLHWHEDDIMGSQRCWLEKILCLYREMKWKPSAVCLMAPVTSCHAADFISFCFVLKIPKQELIIHSRKNAQMFYQWWPWNDCSLLVLMKMNFKCERQKEAMSRTFYF